MIESFQPPVDVTSESETKQISRRRFLTLTGITTGSFILGAMLPAGLPVWADANVHNANNNTLNVFVAIESSGQVNIVCHRSEMGQGVRTSIPQIVADELCVAWEDVNVVQGLADEAYGSQNTDGSRSIRRFYSKMREMGAMARTMLEQAASEQWGIPITDVYAKDSVVVNKITLEEMTFGALAELASKIKAPLIESLIFKSKKDFKYIGKPMQIVDLPDIVTGSTTFGQDIKLEGMLYASIERNPVVGSRVVSFDKNSAMNVSGVVDVFNMPEQPFPVVFNPSNGVAVIATNTWAATQGRNSLNIQWSDSPHDKHNSTDYLAELNTRIVTKGKVIRQGGDAYNAMNNATQKIAATYTVPYLVHAPMEPPAATAVLKDGMCEIWACTQTPQSTQQNVATALGLAKEKVKVNVTLLGGGFGRKSKPDFSVEAALIAKQTGKPVKVIWSREDDIRQGYYHAISSQYFEAGLGDNNSVNAWIQRTAFPSIQWSFTGKTDEPSNGELSLGFGDVPFNISHMSCETHKAPAHIRIGWMRSVSNIQHAFAQGSFVDELASAAKIPTQTMWHQLLGEDRIVNPKEQGFEYTNYGESPERFPLDIKRLKYVLDDVVEKSGANQPTVKGEAWGISAHRSFVSYVAVATKVKVEGNKVTVLEMHSSIDAGTIVNPDRVRSQQEGSMIFGLSLAMLGEITVKDGAVQQSNYSDYQVLRMPQCPTIKTYIVESNEIAGGVGEPGTPPVAPSLANAIFHATGKRIRDLPINKHFTV